VIKNRALSMLREGLMPMTYMVADDAVQAPEDPADPLDEPHDSSMACSRHALFIGDNRKPLLARPAVLTSGAVKES
jgi:hypothetical protein